MNSVVHIGSNRRLSMADELGRREGEVFKAYIRYLIFIWHFKPEPDRGLPAILPLLSDTVLSSGCFIVQLNRILQNLLSGT